MNTHSNVFRVLLFLGIFIAAGACKTIAPVGSDIVYTPKIQYSEEDLLSGAAVFGKSLTDKDLPSEAVITLTPEMKTFLEEHVLDVNGSYPRARKLARALFDPEILGMIYDFSETFTASDAFKQRRGNCLAFSYLFAAFAKEAGIKIFFQEVEIPPSWDSITEDLHITTRHVNIRIPRRGWEDIIADINHIGLPYNYKATPMTEQHAVALYYGNMGTNYLLEENYDLAFKYISKALRLAPQEAPLWTNLGVLYRRMGLNDHGERAHFVALEYDGSNQSAISNLSYLYQMTGQVEKEQYFDALSESYRKKNPYYHYYKAKDAYEVELYQEALRHVENAIDRSKDDPNFYILQSEIYESLGDPEKAERALNSANRIKKT